MEGKKIKHYKALNDYFVDALMEDEMFEFDIKLVDDEIIVTTELYKLHYDLLGKTIEDIFGVETVVPVYGGSMHLLCWLFCDSRTVIKLYKYGKI